MKQVQFMSCERFRERVKAVPQTGVSFFVDDLDRLGDGGDMEIVKVVVERVRKERGWPVAVDLVGEAVLDRENSDRTKVEGVVSAAREARGLQVAEELEGQSALDLQRLGDGEALQEIIGETMGLLVFKEPGLVEGDLGIVERVKARTQAREVRRERLAALRPKINPSLKIIDEVRGNLDAEKLKAEDNPLSTRERLALWWASDERRKIWLEGIIIKRFDQAFNIRYGVDDLPALMRKSNFYMPFSALKGKKPVSLITMLDKPESTPLVTELKETAINYNVPVDYRGCGVVFSPAEKPRTLMIARTGMTAASSTLTYSIITKRIPVFSASGFDPETTLLIETFDAFLIAAGYNWEPTR